MISTKILVQSTAAGLMAGAVVLTPLFLCDSGEDLAEAPSTQPQASQLIQPEARLYEQASLRAAPPVAAKSKCDPKLTDQRSLSERNQAARNALAELEKTPVPTVGEHIGADMPVSLQQRLEQYKHSQQVADQVDSRSEQSRKLSRDLIESLAADEVAQPQPPASTTPKEHQILLRLP